MKRINFATNLLGRSYETGRAGVTNSDQIPEVFKVTLEGVGPVGMRFGHNAVYFDAPNLPEGLHDHCMCTHIRDIRRVGPPIWRNIESLNDGRKFVLKIISKKYTFEAASPQERAEIFGYMYWICPQLIR